MIDYDLLITLLLKENTILTIRKISFWLENNSNLYNQVKKPYPCNSRTLPCMCFERNKQCFFIDIYTKLKEQAEFHSQNSLFQNKLFEYEKIKYNNEKRKIWLAENIQIALNNLCFFMMPNYPNIKMSFINGKQNDEFEYCRIQIDGNDFKPIYDFANLVSKLFFEEKLLPNEYAKWKYENEITD